MDSLKIHIVGVGGQGNVLASKLLGEAAILQDLLVVMSETHGMAQRGGVVESSVILGGDRSPVISEHRADVILAFEPMEAARALDKAHKGTLVITSTAPLPPFIPDGTATYPDINALLTFLRARVARLIAFDARAEALAAGNPLGLNMVMLGALYGATSMPLSHENQVAAIRASGKQAFVEANLACFERGFAAARA